MVNINQLLPDEGNFMQNAMAEVATGIEEQVVIKRFVSVTGGDDAAGQAATVNYTTIYTTANISELTAQEIAFSNGFYTGGDLHMESRIQVFGQENYTAAQIAAGRRADQVTYLGRLYKVLGHVMPVFNDGAQFYKATLRQVG